MEFWEGAILVVGGVWLVSHMANKNRTAAVSVIGTASMGKIGTSNESNLTNITNQAGGYPAIVGESLEAPQPSIATSTPMLPPMKVNPTPIAQPIYKPVTPINPRSGAIMAPPSPVRIARPIDVML